MGNKLKICVGAGYKFDFSISLINEQAFLILLPKKCQEYFLQKKNDLQDVFNPNFLPLAHYHVCQTPNENDFH